MTPEIKDAPHEEPLTIVEPPFNFNAPGVSKYAPEITGNVLLNSLCTRLGWRDLSDKRLLDFGCGVRLARTIVNLEIKIRLYVGVDVNDAAIDWLRTNIEKPNLKFYHFDVANALYRPTGPIREASIFPMIDAYGDLDAASMFSVITHQPPDDAQFIFTLLHKATKPGGQMYFTAFLDPEIAEYVEGVPETPGMRSVYSPSFLCSIAERAGWRVTDIYKPINFQQFGLRCHKG